MSKVVVAPLEELVMRRKGSVLVALVVTAAWFWPAGTVDWGPVAAAIAEVAGAGDWRRASLWDDGKAEFSVYETTWRRYGQLYTGRSLLILVKEPWAPDLNVKADTPRADGYDVLKLNHVRDVPTGIYTYNQMASVYFRRDNGALVKIATTSSEACGVSTALMVDGKLETHSYFDGQGDRRQTFPRHALPADGLPALLRDYVHGEVPTTLDVFPLLMMGRFNELAPRTYRVERREVAELSVPAGTFEAVEIVLSRDGDELAYAFENAPPFRMLRFRRGNGTEYRLAKSERIAYWTMHDPGDEAWIPEHLRSSDGRPAP